MAMYSRTRSGAAPAHRGGGGDEHGRRSSPPRRGGGRRRPVPRAARAPGRAPRGEVDVAAAHRQPVGVADGRADDDLGPGVEVRGEAADDGALLGVLLAEVGAVGAGGDEQLRHHQRDALEVAGAQRAFEGRADRPCRPPPRWRSRSRTSLAGSGTKAALDALARRASRGRRRRVLRVAGEVVAGVELRRVDEDADHHPVALLAGAGGPGCDGRRGVLPSSGTRPTLRPAARQRSDWRRIAAGVGRTRGAWVEVVHGGSQW